MDGPKCQGTLDKQGKITWVWKTYWFVLKSDQLTYVRQDKGKVISRSKLAAKPGRIDMNQASAVRLTKQNSHGFPFEIVTKSRTYLLCTKTAELQDKWVSTLKEAMTWRERKSSVTVTPSMNRASCQSISEDEDDGDSLYERIKPTAGSSSPTFRKKPPHLRSHAKPNRIDEVKRRIYSSPEFDNNNSTSDGHQNRDKSRNFSDPRDDYSDILRRPRQSESSMGTSPPGCSDDVFGVWCPVSPPMDHGDVVPSRPDERADGVPDYATVDKNAKTHAALRRLYKPVAPKPGEKKLTAESAAYASISVDRGSDDIPPFLTVSGSYSDAVDCIPEYSEVGENPYDEVFMSESIDGATLPVRGRQTRTIENHVTAINLEDDGKYNLSSESYTCPRENLSKQLDTYFRFQPIPDLAYPRLELTWSSVFDEIRLFIANDRGPNEFYAKPRKDEKLDGSGIHKLRAFLATLG